MADRPTPSAELPAGVRDRLVQLLAGELTVAWDAAVAAGGAPGRLTEIIDDRRRRLAVSPDVGEAAEG